MARIGFSEAARLAGVSRQHLYKMADAGQISVVQELLPGKVGDAPKDYRRLIDVSELQRVFGDLSVTSEKTSSTDDGFPLLAAELDAMRQLLRDREEQLREAKEREKWLKQQITEMATTVKLIGHSMSHEVVSKMDYDKALARGKEKFQGMRSRIHELEQQLEEDRNQGIWSRIVIGGFVGLVAACSVVGFVIVLKQ